MIEIGILKHGTNTLVIKRASSGDNFLIGNVVVHWRESDGPVSEKPGVRAFPTHGPERPMVPSEAPPRGCTGESPPMGLHRGKGTYGQSASEAAGCHHGPVRGKPAPQLFGQALG